MLINLKVSAESICRVYSFSLSHLEQVNGDFVCLWLILFNSETDINFVEYCECRVTKGNASCNGRDPLSGKHGNKHPIFDERSDLLNVRQL